MTEPFELSALEAVQRINAGDLTAEALMLSCLERVTARDDAVHAWAHLDRDQAIEAAKAADSAGNPGPLAGLPVGVKDIIDTADMPTRYGSTIYGLNRPNTDAAIVRKTRAIGGIVMGKTVTTEFAWRNPGPTRNPNHPEHTPGGSSSGSAAGVADGQFPLAFGTQTAGSVIRPAAYCGAVGYKPTIGTHERIGVKELSSYLDTVGTMARSVSDVTFFDYALRGSNMPDLGAFDGTPPRFGTMVPFRCNASDDALTAFDEGCHAAERAGALVVDIPSSISFEHLGDVHAIVMTGDGGRALAWEYDHHPERLIRYYRDNIAVGRAISDEGLAAAKMEADAARKTQQATLFEHVDVLLTLPAPGEAPKDLGFTGDPLFNKIWTLLGWPCVTIPCGKSANGLPFGVQVVGPTGEDGRTLAAAAWFERALA